MRPVPREQTAGVTSTSGMSCAESASPRRNHNRLHAQEAHCRSDLGEYSMKKLFLATATFIALTSVAIAHPVKLDSSQLDHTIAAGSNGNGNGNGNGNLGSGNGNGNGNGNIGSHNGNGNGNGNVGYGNGNHNGNANYGCGNGNDNGNYNSGNRNGNGNGNCNGDC